MWTSQHRLLSFDGTPLFFRCLKPKTPPRAVVFIVHGMGEHGGRYLALAEHLGDNGLESVAMDLRGFGKSGPERRAHVNRFSDFHSDLWAVHSFVEKSHKGLPRFFLGHSFGGLVAASYLARRHVEASGLILSSPIFGVALPVPWWRHALGIAASAIFPTHTESTRINPATLTHDKGILALYGKDPLIFHRISARLYGELCRMMAERRRVAEEIHCPTLLLQAGEDRVVDKEKSLLFYNELKSADKELEVYPGLYHEILNETGRVPIFKKISSWIHKRLTAQLA